MFSPAGIEKLKDLRRKLSEIKPTTKTPADDGAGPSTGEVAQGPTAKNSSEYSRKMITDDALKLIAEALENNSLKYWKKRANLFDVLRHFDGNTETYAPAIFNQESYELAQVCNEFLRTFNVETDLDLSGAEKAVLKWLGNPQAHIDTAQLELAFNIKIYETLLANVALDAEIIQQRTAIYNDQLDSSDPNSLLSQAKQVCSGQMSHADFQAKYAEVVAGSIAAVEQVPYLRFAGSDQLLNRTEPYQLRELEQLSPLGAQGTLIQLLIRLEENINRELSRSKLAPVSAVLAHFDSLVTDEAARGFRQKFDEAVTAFNKATQDYLNGEGLSRVKKRLMKIAPGKKTLLTDLVAAVKTTIEDNQKQYENYSVSEVMMLFLKARFEHQQLIANSRKQIAPGRAAGLLDKHAEVFFNTFFAVNVSNDPNLQKQLNEHRKAIIEAQRKAHETAESTADGDAAAAPVPEGP